MSVERRQQVFPLAVSVRIRMLLIGLCVIPILDLPLRQVPCSVIRILIPVLRYARGVVGGGIPQLAHLVIRVRPVAVVLQVCDPRDVVSCIIGVPVPGQLRAAPFRRGVVRLRQRCGRSAFTPRQVAVVLLQHLSHSSLTQPGQLVIFVQNPAVGEQRHSLQNAFRRVLQVRHHSASVSIIIEAFFSAVNYSRDRIIHSRQAVVAVVLVHCLQLRRPAALRRADQPADAVVLVAVCDLLSPVAVLHLIQLAVSCVPVRVRISVRRAGPARTSQVVVFVLRIRSVAVGLTLQRAVLCSVGIRHQRPVSHLRLD